MTSPKECIFVSQVNSLLPLPPVTPPFTSPFPTTLTNGETLTLAAVHLADCCGRERDFSRGVLLSAVINWSATFSPAAGSPVINTAGFADVTFEFVRNRTVVYTVSQTALQKGIPLNQPTTLFTQANPTYEIASLLFFDALPPVCRLRPLTYSLRATNIVLTPPAVSTGGAGAAAAVGAVTFVVTV